MTDITREQFEAWATKNGISTVRCPQAMMFANGQRRAAGDYIMIESLCAWAAWQASREAVVVELPARKVYESHADTSSFKDGFNRCHTESRDLIEAQGLKVAP